MAKKRIVIIGGGIYGASLAYYASKYGADVSVVDMYSPPHSHGSSHGGTRVTRFSVFEGAHYHQTAVRTLVLLLRLQAEPGVEDFLFEKYDDPNLSALNGTLLFGPKGDIISAHGTQAKNFITRSISLAKDFKIAHDVLSGRDIRKKFPYFIIPDSDVESIEGYLEHSGTLYPERCVHAFLYLAKRQGAKVITNTLVQDVKKIGNEKVVTFSDGEHVTTDEVVVCAGSWVRKFLPPEFGPYFKTPKQFFAWFACDNPREFSFANYPTFVCAFTNKQGRPDLFYGFPSDKDGMSKLAQESDEEINPDDLSERFVPEDRIRNLFEVASRHIKGLQYPAKKISTCTYTRTIDHNFVIDTHPEKDWQTIVSACQGHGFKNSAALMEALAIRLTGYMLPEPEAAAIVSLEHYRWNLRALKAA